MKNFIMAIKNLRNSFFRKCLLIGKYGLVLGFICATGQSLVAQKGIREPSSFFPSVQSKILILGTFHFDYPDLDAHVTEAENRVDILSESRQKEMRQLIEYIKRFKPTKIAVEARDEWNATAKLRDYLAGRMILGRDERYQIGLRLAAELHLDTIYSIDARSLAEELEVRDSLFIKEMFKDYDFETTDTMSACAQNWFSYEDKLKKEMKLLPYFKHINSIESHRIGYGIYLVGDFKLDEYRGADVLSLWWYNRNLRIFRKIQTISQTPGERILVLVGNGHAAVLRQLFECSPEFELVEFGNL